VGAPVCDPARERPERAVRPVSRLEDTRIAAAAPINSQETNLSLLLRQVRRRDPLLLGKEPGRDRRVRLACC